MNDLYKGLKATKQRKLVTDTIMELSDKATLKNICLSCKDKVDNSTIYRILNLFCQNNIIEKLVNYNNETYYSIKEEHGHYITCIKCHKKEKIEICPIEKEEEYLINKEGYKIVNHIIQIEAICKDCQNNSTNYLRVN